MADIHPKLQAFIDAANASIDAARELERLRGVEAKARTEWERERRAQHENEQKAP